MNKRGAIRAAIAAYVSLWLVLGCSTIVGVQDFSPGGDGGLADGTVVHESGGDGLGSSSGTDSGSGSGADSGSSGGADAPSDANHPDSGPGCVIGGTTYASGTANPTNACQSCQPSVSTSAWNDVTDGTHCGSGGICHTGACASGCEIGGVYFTTSAANPNNPCQSCQPGTSTSVWSSAANGTGCGNGQVCASGQCGTQCDIGGTVYASGTANPSNACQSCLPGTSTTAWTNVANGTSCASSEVCNGGSCASGCYIGTTV